jgi:hypothetical protein
MKRFTIVDALNSLVPNSEWVVNGENYEDIVWISNDIEKPLKFDIDEELKKLNNEYNLKEYQRLREKEYPDFKEYLDGVVKGDQNQINSYIQKCLKIKEKYPKPEGTE